MTEKNENLSIVQLLKSTSPKNGKRRKNQRFPQFLSSKSYGVEKSSRAINHWRHNEFIEEEGFTWRLWISRLIYQSIFILVLCVVLSALMALLISIQDPFEPRVDNSQRVNAGLGFLPRPPDHLSTLINFRHGNGADGTWRGLVKTVRAFLKAYSHGKRMGAHRKCKWDTILKRDSTRCHVSKRRWIDWNTPYPCHKAEFYGYPQGHPCVMLKINRIYNWEPEPYYNLTEIRAINGMPEWLKGKIEDIWRKKCQGKGREKEEKCPELRMAWISCDGVTAADREYLGKIHYMPKLGFPGYYFPYLKV